MSKPYDEQKKNKKKKGLPPTNTVEDVLVKINQSIRNPNVGQVVQAVLKDGRRILRTATVFEIINPKTKEFHHYSLRIDSIDRLKDGWFSKPKKSVCLEGEDPDEVESLYSFLTMHVEGRLKNKTGEQHIISSDQYAKLEQLIEVLPNMTDSDKIELVKQIFPLIDGAALNAQDFVAALGNSDAVTVSNLAIAARVVEYKKAYEYFEKLVNDDSTSENDLQKHLEVNPWMFGSEYSKLEDRRNWTRDSNLDFMLRRTVDGYLEIVEIKKPIKTSLLRLDNSHSSWYPSAELSKVLGQVMLYIEELDRDRDKIKNMDKCDTLKIRARIIIGHDGDEGHQGALHNLNAHLNRIEIITYDQLLRIGKRVLSVFEPRPSIDSEESKQSADDDDLPF